MFTLMPTDDDAWAMTGIESVVKSSVTSPHVAPHETLCRKRCSASLAMAGPRVAPMLPDPECRELYNGLHAGHRRLYAALRPLFSL